MELNQQIFRAPSIPKISSRTISSSVIRGAVKPQIKLNRSAFSFIKPVQKTIDTEKISTVSAGKDISVEATLGETNRILVEIQKQLALDFGYRIAEEKKALALERKKIAAQKVADKEAKIEKDGRSILGKTFEKVTAPFKSIFQKLIDFFSVILTGILLNTAFKWLSNPENRKKLAEFFNFLKEYWQELLIVFGIAKLAKLVARIFSIASKIKKLLSLWPKKPPTTGTGKDPCKCPKPGSPDFCKNILNCFDPKNIEVLAQRLAATKTFASLLGTLPPIVQPAAKPTTTPATKPLGTRNGASVDQIYEEWNRRYKPAQAQQPPWWKQGGPPKGLSDYMNNLQNGPTAEEKLFKQMNLPAWLAPIVESVAMSFMMRRGRVGGAARLRINPQQYSQPIGPIQSSSKISPPNQRISYEDIQRLMNQSGLRVKSPSIPKPKRTVTSTSTKIDLGELSPLQKTLFKQYKRPELADIAYGRIKTDSETQKAAKELVDKMLIGASNVVQTRSQGGTVGGRGPGNVDTVPAMLAAGEEVIRTSEAMRWRPLLKDINDSAGKLWQAFSGATQKQNTNNIIQSELNKQFNVLIKQFKELIDDEIKRIQSDKNKKKKPGGGGKRPRYQSSVPKINIPRSSVSKNTSNLQTPTIINQQPPQVSNTNVTNNVVQPNLNISQPQIAVLPIPVKNLQRQTQKPKVNVINLPPKTVNLGPKPGSIKTPSSGEATSVPSISPFDSSNPYIAYTRSALGMVM